ncbi:MAG: AMP-binding protein, partial [Bacteroidota bacterium]
MNSKSTGLIAVFEAAIRGNWDLTALSDYGGESFPYKSVGERIVKIHGLFKAAGIQKGDHIALLGKNSAHWGMIYLATITYGAVIVPVLPDFKAADIHYIITHSDSLLMFVEESIFKDLDPESMPLLRHIIKIQDDSLLFTRDRSAGLPGSSSPVLNLSPDQISFPPSHPDDIAVISYTSGTTGFSKGVVLQHKSILGNLRYAHRNMPLNPRDKILSFLPLAHTYGCAFEFLFPFSLGCDITFLTKTPSPKIIMQAFQEIRPSLILSVPLIIEKIFKSQILPALRKPAVRFLISTPLVNHLVYKKIRLKMVDVFGGHFRELVIGGAPFNAQAERVCK